MKKIIFYFILFSSLLSQGFETTKINTVQISGIKYISSLEFSKSNKYRYFFHSKKEKMEFKFENNRILISPYNSFIKVNDNMFQLSSPTLYDGNDILIPAKSFINILNNQNLINADFDTMEQHIIFLVKSYNVLGYMVNNKMNGVEISIKTNKLFDSKNIAGSITAGGWLNITIPNAEIDTQRINQSTPEHPITKFRFIQNQDIAQISFLLATKVDDYEISSFKDRILIQLRTAIAKNAETIKSNRKKWLLDTIVLDPGHGGKDPGAIGVTGIQEKTITLDISKRLGKLLQQESNLNVIYTREEDVFIPLWKRTEIANSSKGKIFISIHANTSPKKSNVKGFETYLLRPGRTDDAIDVALRENAVIDLEENKFEYEEENLILATMAQSAHMQESEFLAKFIQDELDNSLTTNNRGIKQAGFHVLVGASMPNVLIEIGFISNYEEAKLLSKSKYRQTIAKAIFNAIINFKSKYENQLLNP